MCVCVYTSEIFRGHCFIPGQELRSHILLAVPNKQINKYYLIINTNKIEKISGEIEFTQRIEECWNGENTDKYKV